MDKLTEAQAHLDALEQPGRNVETANAALKAAEFTGDPDKIQNARNEYAAAVAAEAQSKITPRDIAKAAQAVLDARGEGHTETGVLPPNHGINTVRAERVHALATSEGTPEQQKAAAEAVKAAIAEDDAAKLAHAAEQHATLQGETA